ncbi:hypothetical protein SLEP1_g53771 [Rubroshorea leprosula]|uniref:Uncharacterized protein n=1 Tax=Rubroshorea leprosula TaxID=152421 RepID=A0AAV5MAC0_9ROSI|nr:hypothetical protein SLEP1_g53771 [Rubroshorea leprosula]
MAILLVLHGPCEDPRHGDGAERNIPLRGLLSKLVVESISFVVAEAIYSAIAGSICSAATAEDIYICFVATVVAADIYSVATVVAADIFSAAAAAVEDICSITATAAKAICSATVGCICFAAAESICFAAIGSIYSVVVAAARAICCYYLSHLLLLPEPFEINWWGMGIPIPCRKQGWGAKLPPIKNPRGDPCPCDLRGRG